MNRIYQGRITGILDSKEDERGHPPPPDPKHNPFWRHHEVYQAAVNYYYVAFAALGRAASDGMLRDLVQRVGESWETDPVHFRPEYGLRASLRQFLPLSDTSTLEEAFERILEKDHASPDTLLKAAMAVAKDLGGESSIQMKGREYLPRLCVPGYKGKFPREKNSLEKERMKVLLPVWLHAEDPASQPTLKKIRFHHFANPTGTRLEVAESKDLLGVAIDTLLRENKITAEEAGTLHDEIDALPDTFTLPAYAGGSVNKDALKLRFHAYLITEHFWKNGRGLELLRSTYPPPKGKPKKVGLSEEEEALLVDGDDPVKVARGDRGYVFRAFTSLPAWGGRSAKDIAWKEFDIAAFKEALTTYNQFKDKTEERAARLRDVQARLARMNGNEPEIPLAKEDKDDIPRLENDPRVALLGELLHDSGVVAEGQTVDRGIYHRSLRHYRDLRSEWNRVLSRASDGDSDSDISKRLISVVNEMQAKYAHTFGDVNLFRGLCSDPKYWPVWKHPDAETKKRIEKEGWAENVVEAYRDFLELQAEEERYSEAIHFRPAHPEESSRYFRFSDVVTKNQTLHEQPGERLKLPIVERNDEGVYTKSSIRVRYSAPRLYRDAVCGNGNEKGHWLQPMVKALSLPEPPEADITNSAIVLNIKTDGENSSDKRVRAYVDFPVELDTSPLKEHLGHTRKWAKQFNGQYDRGVPYPSAGGGLYWPDMQGLPSDPWYENPAIQASGFQVLGVDLGQRTAECHALIEIRCDGKFPQKKDGTSRDILATVGHDGTRTWEAVLLRAGTGRLPGENAHQMEQGRRVREKGGRRGRKTSDEDYRIAVEILEKIGLREIAESHRPLNDFKYAPELWDFVLRYLKWIRNRLGRLFFAAADLRDDELRDKVATRLEEYPIPGIELPSPLKERHEEAAELCLARYTELLETFRSALLLLTDQILPLRGRRWTWAPHPQFPESTHHILMETPEPSTKGRKIRGQRGLSFNRIEQIQELRKQFQALNRMEGWDIQAPHRPGRDEIRQSLPECCQPLLEKLDNLRTQRVNQTAHLILQEALGVELAPGEKNATGDEHGVYRVKHGRRPVDIIVLEALGDFKTSQKRGRGTNRRLASWAHRGISAKLRELAEPFGIPVVETPPHNTSTFHAFTGRPGYRAREMSGIEMERIQTKLEEKKTPKTFRETLIKAGIDAMRESGTPPEKMTLLVPQQMGELFLPLTGPDEPALPPIQSDINAAINIALKMVSAPEAVHLRHTVRFETPAGKPVTPGKGSKLEKALAKRKNVTFEIGDEFHAPQARIDRANLLGTPAGTVHTPIGSFDFMSRDAMRNLLSHYKDDMFIQANKRALEKRGISFPMTPSNHPFSAGDFMDEHFPM